ncbi:MAG: hypothetical protein M0Z89_04105 [Nitrospiraceae bacterium]|nr:hypothetical protein [Nitrospiraceae bacterium]
MDKPAVILGDEPTGNLDTKTGAKVLEMREGLQDEDRTIVMVTYSEEKRNGRAELSRSAMVRLCNAADERNQHQNVTS